MVVGETTIHRVPVGAAGETLAVRLENPERARAHLELPCLLFVHGLGSTQDGEKATSFRRMATARGHAFASFDFRGHGASGGSLRELTMSRNLDDLDAVVGWLEARGWARPVLVGSSMGAAAALWFSVRQPARVRAGMHLAPGLWMAEGLARWAGERFEEWRSRGAIRLRNQWLEAELGWGLMADLGAYRAEEVADRLATPTLIVQGIEDDTVPWRKVADFVGACRERRVELVLVRDGDHRLTAHEERVWEWMVGFLAARVLRAGDRAAS